MSALEQWLRDYDAYDMDIVLQLEQEGLTHPKKDLENVDDAAWNRIKDHIKHYRQNDTEIDRKLAKVDELFSEIRNWEDKGHALNIDDEVEEESTTKFKVPIIGKQESVVDALLNVTMKSQSKMDGHKSNVRRVMFNISNDSLEADNSSSSSSPPHPEPTTSKQNVDGPLLKTVISKILLDDDAILSGGDGLEQEPQINADSTINMSMLHTTLTLSDLGSIAEGHSFCRSMSPSGEMVSPLMVGGSGFTAENYDMDSDGAWMEDDDELRLSQEDDDDINDDDDDDINGRMEWKEHHRVDTAATMISNASSVDLQSEISEPESEWKEEDDKLKLSDDEKEEEPTEHYQIATSKSTVDLLMSGPEQEPDWKEEDDKLKLSDDEKEEESVTAIDGTEHYKITTTKSTVDLLMNGPETEPNWKTQDDKLNFSDDEESEKQNDGGDGVTKYGKVTAHKSTVDLLMAGPDGPGPADDTKKVRFEEEEWKEQDDALRLSDDEPEPKVHYKRVEITANVSTVDLLMSGPETGWKEEDDKLRLSDDEKEKEDEVEAMEHYKITAAKSAVDLLMNGPETEPYWKEQDDALRFSDDEMAPKVHYQSVGTAANMSTVDLLMTGPEGEGEESGSNTVQNVNDDEDEDVDGDQEHGAETVLYRRKRSIPNQMIQCPFCSLFRF